MHDIVEVTCTVLCHMHLVVCQTCDWIAVSGRYQAVLLFLYSEHLPLSVCAKTHTERGRCVDIRHYCLLLPDV